MGFLSRKKGQTVFDTITLLIALFIIALGAVVGSMVFSGVNDDFQADATINADAKAAMSSMNVGYSTWFDAAILSALIFFWVLLLVTSFLIDTHPVFFIVTVVLLLAVFVVSMYIANAYEELMLDDDLAPFAVNFPFTNFIMSNLLLIMIVMGLSTGVALYAKFSG